MKFIIYSFSLLAISFISYATAPLTIESSATKLLSFVSADHSGWKLLSGNAKIDETISYLGQQSLALDGSDGGTVLSRELSANEAAFLQTNVHVLPNVGPEGDLSLNLNGVSLHFADAGFDKLSVSYYDGIKWVEVGAYESVAWLHLELVQDYTQGTALLKINGDSIIEKLKFTEEISNIYYLEVTGSADSKLLVNSLFQYVSRNYALSLQDFE